VILLNNISKRDRILIIIVGLALICYGYFTFILTPVSNKIAEEQRVITNKKSQYKNIEIMKVSNPQNEKKLEEAKKKFDDSVKQLPKNERNPDITYNFNKLVTEGNVTLKSLVFGKDTEYSLKKNDATTSTKPSVVDTSATSTKLMFVPVTVVVMGNYLSTLKFISVIENDTRITDIQTVTIVATTLGEAGLETTFLLNYYFGESENKDEPTYDMPSINVGKENLFK